MRHLRNGIARGNTVGIRNPPGRRLVELLTEETPTLIGIDHGFSFPLRYFETHGLKLDCAAFLDDFQRHWPTDEDHAYVDFDASGHCQRVVRTTTTTDDVKLNQPLAQQSCENFRDLVP